MVLSPCVSLLDRKALDTLLSDEIVSVKLHQPKGKTRTARVTRDNVPSSFTFLKFPVGFSHQVFSDLLVQSIYVAVMKKEHEELPTTEIISSRTFNKFNPSQKC